VTLLRSHLRALALDDSALPPRSLRFNLTALGAHLLALLAVARLAHWPPWIAPLLLAAFCVPQLVLRRWRVERLAPLFAVYAFAPVRLFIVYILRQTAPPALDYAWGVLVSGVWIGLMALAAIRRLPLAWTLLAAGSAALLVGVARLNLPAGVTGSDPFVYLQMGLDLARHGTPLHRFPLAPFVAGLGLPTLPAAHVGYVLPNAEGLAPTVWPPGFSVLLALAFRLGGEGAMLALNVWLCVLSLAFTAALAALIAPRRNGRGHLLAVGAGAAFVLATSFEQFTAAVVPMADISTQLFTTLALLFILYSFRASLPTLPHLHTCALFSGLALAAAYSIRYTQALVAPGLALAAWFGLKDAQRRYSFLAALAVAALVGALPDVWLRTRLYGAPWGFGSGELALFSVQAAPEALRRLGEEFLAPTEFQWLWPLTIAGGVELWRRNRFGLAALGATYGLLLLFHVWYPYVRLRDLLSLYAPLAALTALGGAMILRVLWTRGHTMRLMTVAGGLALAFLRLSALWGLREGGFFTFGYLCPEQRQSLERIATLTEPEAVVAASLNSGAVELYGGRATVRPGRILQPITSWDTAQWLLFVAALRDQRRPLYLLMDSPEMDEPLAALREHYTLTHVADLSVPVFFHGGGSRNLTVPLYRVDLIPHPPPLAPPPSPRPWAGEGGGA
jgi:hypothetical protein